MTAKIVWRNPMPPVKDGSSIERLASNPSGAMYAVTCKSDPQQKFELILGPIPAIRMAR